MIIFYLNQENDPYSQDIGCQTFTTFTIFINTNFIVLKNFLSFIFLINIIIKLNVITMSKQTKLTANIAEITCGPQFQLWKLNYLPILTISTFLFNQ